MDNLDKTSENYVEKSSLSPLGGITLEEILKKEGKIESEHVFALMKQLIKSLAEEHRAGKIHGGIRPDRIMIYDRLWLCFRIPDDMTKRCLDGWKNHTGYAVITEDNAVPVSGSYLSLEECLDTPQAGKWSDVYSLCAVMYHALTGTPPPESRERMGGGVLIAPSELGVRIENAQEETLMKGLALLIGDRCQDAEELYKRLYENREANAVKEDKKAGYGNDGQKEPKEKKGCLKRRIVVGIGGSMVLFGAAMFLTAFMRGRVEGIQDPQIPVKQVAENTEPSQVEPTNPPQKVQPEEDNAENSGTFGSPEPEPQSVQNVLRDNVWRSDDENREYMLGTGVKRRDVVSVVFLDNLEVMPDNYWDVSRDKNGSVVAWAELSLEAEVSADAQGIGYDLYIAGDGGVAADSCEDFFRYCSRLKRIEFNNCFDTSQVWSMEKMFMFCSSLTELDMNCFNTSHVGDMNHMFYDCSSLAELDISGFETSQVRDMEYMFYGCNSLTKLDVSAFDTSQVVDMGHMFYDCNSLMELDISNFDTSQVTEMGSMFCGCGQVTKLDVSGFNTSKVKSMACMFEGCAHLTELNVSGFDISNVTTVSRMFRDCGQIMKLDVSAFDTSNVKFMSGMFRNCRSLAELDVSNFNTSRVTDMADMFCFCSNLLMLDVSNFDTSQVTDMEAMFYNCSSLRDLDVSGFNTLQVRNMEKMFMGCSSLTKLDLDSFDMSNARTWNMLQGTLWE